MTKRTTKILLPHPMPATFAREFCLLMTGYDDTSPVGRYIIGSILEASWTSADAINPIRVYHRLRAAEVPSAARVRAATGTGEPELLQDMRKVNRVLSALSDSLLETDLNPVVELACTRWLEAIKTLAAGLEPMASGLTSLLATYGVFSGETNSGGEGVHAYAHEQMAEGGMLVFSHNGVPPHLLGLLMNGPPLSMHEALNGARPPASESRALRTVPVDPTKPNLRVFKQADVVSLVQRLPASQMPNEGNAQQRRLLEAMANDDGLRTLSEVPEGDPLAELYGRFPHFKDVLDLVQDALALAASGSEGKPVRLPPILLRGDPGTGKTYFAQELGRVLGLHFVERDLSVTSEAFVISGQDAGWKNSKPGIVFDAVVNGKTANPLVLLNEVDKASITGNHNSPMAALYALLEPTSASAFTDEFVPIGINASQVVWVLTANKGDIPEPILDRLEVFDIRLPNKEECRIIAASVWTSVCQRAMPQGHGFCEDLGEPLLDFMSNVSPRIMRKALTNAAGKAARAGRKYLTLEDLDAGQKRYAPKTRATMGFTASKVA